MSYDEQQLSDLKELMTTAQAQLANPNSASRLLKNEPARALLDSLYYSLKALLTPSPSSGPFDLLYLDPPWRFANWSIGEMAKYGEKWARRMGRSPYHVMTTRDMAKMPIGDLGARHSIMLMWGTYPKLEDALFLMRAYGYEFKTIAFTWVKQNPSGIGWHFGLGYHTRQNAEIVLLGTRGKGLRRVDNTVPNLLIYPRGAHSAKPPITRERIERLYGPVARLELYARSAAPGWTAWGNEVTTPDPTASELLKDFLIPPTSAIVDEDEFLGLAPTHDSPQPAQTYDSYGQLELRSFSHV